MSRNYKIFILVVAVVLSLSGGIIGGIIFRFYLINSFFGIPLWGDINLSDDYQQGKIIISQPKKVVVEQNDRIFEVVSKANENKINFYIKKQLPIVNKEDTNESDFDIKKYYFPEDKIGAGLILTNDGWIITAVKINKPTSYIAVDSDNNIISITASFFDEISGFYFVKLEANNLSVAQFAEESNLGAGQLIITFNENGIKRTYLEDTNYYLANTLVKSSESLQSYLRINEDNLAKGDICISLNNEVVGLYMENGALIPINYFKKLLPNLLNNKKIIRPILGVNYIILDELIGEKDLIGALIAKDAVGIAVKKGSPAALAGLKEGNIILEVNGVKVSKDNTLSDIILNYGVNTELELSILREGVESKIKVKLSGE